MTPFTPGSFLCVVLVTIPWAGSPSLIEFHSIDNYCILITHMCTCMQGGSGRNGWSTTSKPIIGNVILHDKLKFWESGDRSIHYHQGKKMHFGS